MLLTRSKATVIAALSFEGLLGFSNAMDQRIHASKRHKGQQKVAKVIRSLIRNKHQSSQIGEHKCFDRIMDPYTLRCIPQGTSFSLYIILFFSPRNRPWNYRLCSLCSWSWAEFGNWQPDDFGSSRHNNKLWQFSRRVSSKDTGYLGDWCSWAR